MIRFFKNFKTKKQLKETIEKYEHEIVRLTDLLTVLECDYLTKLNSFLQNYPFEFGQVVYDVQLRNEKGHFTKVNASREHSKINEVIVDKKNYFNLVDRYNKQDVFTSMEEAVKHLDEICVK